jgi:hypothetical protein
MQAPSVEWGMAIGHLLVLDYLRARGDADNDTASECLRSIVARHQLGPAAFTVALVGGCAWFHRHILGPLRTDAARTAPAPRAPRR